MKRFVAFLFLAVGLVAVALPADAQFLRKPRGVLALETVGRLTRSGVVIGQLAAGATLSGTNSNHFTVTSGAISVNSTGQGSLAASYNLVVTGDPSYTNVTFATDVNTYSVNTNVQAGAAVINGAATDNTQLYNVYYRDGTVATDSVTLTTQFVGTVSNLTAGITPASGDATIRAAINPGVANPTASVSGGGALVGCRVALNCAVQNITLNGVSPLIIDGLNFTAAPSTDSYDAKFTFITQPVRFTPTVSGGAVTGVSSVTQTGTGFLVPGAKKSFVSLISGPGSGFVGFFTTNADGTIDGSSVLTITSGGSSFDGTSVLGTNITGTNAGSTTQQTDTSGAAGLNQLTISKSNCTTTITIASPGVFTCTNHGYVIGTRLSCSTTGALPTGLTAGAALYVVSVPTSSTYTVSATTGGSAINTSGSQSGTQTCGSVPNIIIRNSQFGNSGAANPLRTSGIMRINSVGTFVFEDNQINWFYKGIFYEGCGEVDVRRNWFRNYTNDVEDLYPSSSLTVAVSSFLCNYRRYNNLVSNITQSLYWSNSHADALQWLTPGDLQSFNVVVGYEHWFIPADVLYTTSQGIIGDDANAVSANTWINNNLIITSASNAIQISAGKVSGNSSYGYNTAFRSNYANYASSCGIWTSCGWTASGTKEEIEPAFAYNYATTVTISNASPAVVTWTNHGATAGDQYTTTVSGGSLPSPLASGTNYVVKTVLDANTFTISATVGGAAINTTTSGSGTFTGKLTPVGVIYTLSNNIIGAFSELSPAPANTYCPSGCTGTGDGTRTRAGQFWQWTSASTCYLTELTNNTGAGNSMPENLNGPFSSYGGTNVGWYLWWNAIRTDTMAHANSDLDAMFATIPASSCDGKGYLAHP